MCDNSLRAPTSELLWAGANLEGNAEDGPTGATALRVMVLSSLPPLPAPPYPSGE